MKPSFDTVIRMLLEIRESQHDDVNASVREEIDSAIAQLRAIESEQQGNNEAARRMALYAVGQALRALPSIQRMLSQFID